MPAVNWKRAANVIGTQLRLKKLLKVRKVRIVVRLIQSTSVGFYDPRTNSIVLDPDLPAEEVIKTLLHELKHAEQHQSGRLITDIAGGTFTWCGVVYDCEEFDYDTMPWEIEAEQFAQDVFPLISMPCVYE